VCFIVVLLVSITPISATQYNLIYDDNGNLVTGDGKYREYNNFNQLLRIRNGSDSSGQVLEEYIYHPTEDRILVKYVYNNTNNVRQSFLYVNDNFVRSYEMRGIREVNDSYYMKDDYGIVAEKRYNGTTLNEDFSEGVTLYYHNDHLGSTTLITDSSGNEVEETFYSPYGEVLEGGTKSRYQYEGKEFSSTTGEYDFNFRTYNPELGLFTQPDAVFSNIYDPQSLNRYRFERNNPYKYVDEDGKVISVPVALGVGALAGGIDFLINYFVFKNDFRTSLSYASVTAVATGLGVATFGATSVAGGAGVASRYIAPTGLKYAARTGTLGAIGGAQSYVEQSYIEDGSKLSYSEIGIYGTTNAFLGPKTFSGAPGVIIRESGQFYPNKIGLSLFRESTSLGLVSTYTSYGVNKPLSLFSNQLFSPKSSQSSLNQNQRRNGGGNKNFTPANGCGVIKSCIK